MEKKERPIRRKKFVQVLNQLKGEKIYHENLGRWTSEELPDEGQVLTIRGREFTVVEVIDDDEYRHGVRNSNLISIIVDENISKKDKLDIVKAKERNLQVIRARNKELRDRFKELKWDINRKKGD